MKDVIYFWWGLCLGKFHFRQYRGHFFVLPYAPTDGGVPLEQFQNGAHDGKSLPGKKQCPVKESKCYFYLFFNETTKKQLARGRSET